MAGQVAVIGMGRMGAAMARRLAEAGFAVTVHNRTPDKAQAVATEIGGVVAATPREAAASAPVVVSSLADDAAVHAVYDGPDGLAAGVAEGTVVLETSTIDPLTVDKVVPLVKRAGGVLLDAPVSGSVPAVEQGALMIMVGGEAEALARARPVLDVLASRVFRLGDSGAGATMKLAVNGIVHGVNVALSEALVLAERAGIERERAYEVFLNSAAAAPFLQYKQQAFERPGEGPVAFSVALSAKDLDLILTLAQRVDVPMAQASANRQVARAAMAAGWADADMSAVAEHLRGSSAAVPPGMDVIDRHFAAENAHDVEATLATYTEDVVWDDITHPGSPFRGKQAVGEVYSSILDAIPDVDLRSVRRFAADDGRYVVDESILTGHVEGVWAGVEGRGAAVRTRILHIFELRDGLIAAENAWFNAADVLAQVQDHLRQQQ